MSGKSGASIGFFLDSCLEEDEPEGDSFDSKEHVSQVTGSVCD